MFEPLTKVDENEDKHEKSNHRQDRACLFGNPGKESTSALAVQPTCLRVCSRTAATTRL